MSPESWFPKTIMAATTNKELEKVQEDENYKNPLGVTSDEEGNNFVRVQVIFPELKKKTFRNEAANGVVVVKVEVRSLIVTVKLQQQADKLRYDLYRYKVIQLPDEVDPTQSYHKIRKGQVVIFLKKVKARSWARELAEGGLETYVDEDEEENMDMN